jgi:hypothetical protein
LGSAIAPENQRQAPYSSVGQPFHTDTGDIIALYILGEAECGGESNLVPIATVYNDIAKTRPDVIRLLAEPSWVFDRFGLSPPYTVRSILYPLRGGGARKPDCFVSFCVFVSLGHFQRSYPLRFRLNQNLCGDFRVRSEMMSAQFSHPAPSVVPCCSFLLRFGPSADVVQTRWSRLVSSLGRHPTTRVYSNRST